MKVYTFIVHNCVVGDLLPLPQEVSWDRYDNGMVHAMFSDGFITDLYLQKHRPYALKNRGGWTDPYEFMTEDDGGYDCKVYVTGYGMNVMDQERYAYQKAIKERRKILMKRQRSIRPRYIGERNNNRFY